VESLRTDPIFAVVLARGNLIEWRAFIGGAKRRHLLYIKARKDLKLPFLHKITVIFSYKNLAIFDRKFSFTYKGTLEPVWLNYKFMHNH